MSWAAQGFTHLGGVDPFDVDIPGLSLSHAHSPQVKLPVKDCPDSIYSGIPGPGRWGPHQGGRVGPPTQLNVGST